MSLTPDRPAEGGTPDEIAAAMMYEPTVVMHLMNFSMFQTLIESGMDEAEAHELLEAARDTYNFRVAPATYEHLRSTVLAAMRDEEYEGAVDLSDDLLRELISGELPPGMPRLSA
jgi:hypothetical protein